MNDIINKRGIQGKEEVWKENVDSTLGMLHLRWLRLDTDVGGISVGLIVKL